MILKKETAYLVFTWPIKVLTAGDKYYLLCASSPPSPLALSSPFLLFIISSSVIIANNRNSTMRQICFRDQLISLCLLNVTFLPFGRISDFVLISLAADFLSYAVTRLPLCPQRDVRRPLYVL